MTQRVEEISLEAALQALQDAKGESEEREALIPKETAPHKLRVAEPKDYNFIMKSWLESVRYSGFHADCFNHVYYPNQQKVIAKVASRPGCICIVAVDQVDDEQIMGFCIAEPAKKVEGKHTPLILHYLYVKQIFRGFNLVKPMLRQFGWNPGEVILSTQITNAMRAKDRLLMKKFNVIYNPYVLIVDDWFKGWVDEK